MDLSVVIVSWRVAEKLKSNLSALFKSQGDFKFEVFVVDNNSGDGTVEMVRQDFPQVNLIANTENRGFAAANNQALRICTGDFVLLLNPDMLVAGNTLANMFAWAKVNPQATVSGCKLVNERGEIIKQVRRFPKLCDQLAVTLKLPHIFPGVLNNYLASDFDYTRAAKVDSIRGAFFLINRASWEKIVDKKLPLLDERYFIWFEEVDFCREVYKLGGEVWYTPAAECLDYVGQSFAQVKRGQAQKYFSESMLQYFKKWEKRWKYIVLKIIWSLIRIFV